MSANIFFVILVTSLATYLSRFLGVLSSEKIKETSKIFRWFNCLAYSTLSALIVRIVVFPVGVLSDASYLSRFIVIIISLLLFYLTKKNLIYPTAISVLLLVMVNNIF
jgi:branched-subunit amino acid transport protein